MNEVILDMSMSLDGFIAGENDTDAGLHNWYFSPSNENRVLIDDLIKTTGVIVMGRRSYEMGNQYDGWVDNPYQVPHLIITHTIPETPAKGNTEFIFATDGVENGIKQAKDIAGGKNVVFGGGADIAHQLLNAQLLDEIHIHLVPILIGQGIRLWDKLEDIVQLEKIEVIVTEGVTHLKYRVLK